MLTMRWATIAPSLFVRCFDPGVAIAASGGGAVRRLFNALNYVGRRGADSTDWADEPMDRSLLNGHGPISRTRAMTLPR
jgi:hypothetical protein